MPPATEPTPPSRKEEDFPRTSTIPDGWVMDELMEVYNPDSSGDHHEAASPQEQAIPVPATGAVHVKINGKTVPVQPVSGACEAPASASESLFSRRLEPFPSAWDLTGTGL